MKDNGVKHLVKGQKAHDVGLKTECSHSVPGKQSKQELLEKKKKWKYMMKLKKCAELSSKKELSKFKKPQVSSAKELVKVRKPSGEISKKKNTLPCSMTDLSKVSNAGPSSASDLGMIKNQTLLMKEHYTYNMTSGNELQKPIQIKELPTKKTGNMTTPSAATDSSLRKRYKQTKEPDVNKKESSKNNNNGRTTRDQYLSQGYNFEMKDKTDSVNELYKVGKPSVMPDHTFYEKPIWIKELFANDTGFKKEQGDIRKPSVGPDHNKVQELSQMKEFSAKKPCSMKELYKVRQASARSDRSSLRKNNQPKEVAQEIQLFCGRKSDNLPVPQKNKINEVRAKKTDVTKDSTKVKEALTSSALNVGPDDRTRTQTEELSKYRMWEDFKMKRLGRKRKENERKEPRSSINRESREFSSNNRQQSQNKELTTCGVRDANAINPYRSNEGEWVTDMRNRELLQEQQIDSYNRRQRRTDELDYAEFGYTEQSHSSRMVPRKYDINSVIESHPRIRKQTPTCTVTGSSLKIRKMEESSCNIVQKQRPSCTITNANRESYSGHMNERFDANIPDELYYRNHRNPCSDAQDYRQGTQEQWTGYSCM